MIKNKSNIMIATLAVLLLNACGNSSDNNIANSCETSYVVLSQTIDKDADGMTDQITTYNYNEAGKLISIIDDNISENISTFTYNDQGFIEQEIYYEYYGLDLVKDYTYDSNGNIITEEWTPITNDEVSSSLTYDNIYNYYFERFYIYEYDEDNILTSAIITEYNNSSTNVTYQYDDYGNILTEVYEYNLNGSEHNVISSYNYTYSADRKILEKKVDFDSDGALDVIYTFTYDNNGYKIEQRQDYNGNGIDDLIVQSKWGCI